MQNNPRIADILQRNPQTLFFSDPFIYKNFTNYFQNYKKKYIQRRRPGLTTRIDVTIQEFKCFRIRQTWQIGDVNVSHVSKVQTVQYIQ